MYILEAVLCICGTVVKRYSSRTRSPAISYIYIYVDKLYICTWGSAEDWDSQLTSTSAGTEIYN